MPCSSSNRASNSSSVILSSAVDSSPELGADAGGSWEAGALAAGAEPGPRPLPCSSSSNASNSSSAMSSLPLWEGKVSLGSTLLEPGPLPCPCSSSSNASNSSSSIMSAVLLVALSGCESAGISLMASSSRLNSSSVMSPSARVPGAAPSVGAALLASWSSPDTRRSSAAISRVRWWMTLHTATEKGVTPLPAYQMPPVPRSRGTPARSASSMMATAIRRPTMT